MKPFTKSSLPLVLLFLGLFVPRLILFYIFGPLETLDTGGYTKLASAFFQQDFSWLSPVDLNKSLEEGFRSMGYPLFIAFFWSLTSDWQDPLVLTQMTLSSLAFCSLGYFLEKFLLSRIIAYGAFFLSGLSQILFYDFTVLPDSLTSSFYLLSLSLLGILILRRHSLQTKIPFPFISAVIFCWMSVFLLRANGIVLIATQLPLLLFILWSFPLKRKLLYASFFLLPLFFSYFGYMEWNAYRTGERFLTTGGRSVLFQPLFALEQQGDPIFTNDTLLDKTVQIKAKTYTFGEILEINQDLFNTHHWHAPRIQSEISQKYMQVLMENPWRLFKILHLNTSTKIITSLANPSQSLSLFFRHFSVAGWIDSPTLKLQTLSSYWKEISSTSFLQGTFFLSIPLWNGFSIILFIGFIGLFLKELFCLLVCPEKNTPSFLIVWLSLMYISTVLFYALIHLELRYLLPISPIPIFLGGEGIRRLYAFCKKRGKTTSYL